MANFLAQKMRSGSITSAASLRPYRAAISTTFLALSGVDPSDSYWVSRVMQGADKLMPSKPRYADTWDLDLLFSYWESQPANSLLSFESLRLKALSLLMATAVLRSSDAVAIQRSSLQFLPDELTFQLLNPKNANGLTAPVHVARAKRRRICPVAAMYEYVQRLVSMIPPTSESLWVTMKKPHTSLASKTVASAVLSVLKAAGVPERFKTHSIRSAAVSKAMNMGIPLDEVLLHARWKSERVFRVFYDRSLRGTKVSNAILS